MDCSLAEQHQLQQQQQQREQQQQLNSVNYLDETIRNLTNLAAGVRPSSVLSGSCVGGNNRNNCGSNNSSPIKQIAAGGAVTSSPQPHQQQQNNPVKLRKHSDRCLTSTDPKSHTYRISMANLEETQESELDVILGELSLLEAQIDATFLPPPAATTTATSTAAINSLHSNGGGGGGVGGMMMMNANHMQHNSPGSSAPPTRTHSRTNSTISGATTISMSAASETHSTASSSSGVSENGLSSASTVSISNGSSSSGGSREPRTESPDNDSAFSDTVSLLSSESSASSSVSTQGVHQKHHHHHQQQLQYLQQQGFTNNSSSKAAKIQLALHKLESASIRRLFVKAFTSDGASKSLLVDERMTCGHVTRMLADKNHVQMQPQWSLVESLGDLQMERLFEDHELLVDNLMTWNSDAGNRVLFQQRSDKVALFIKPELFLPGPQMAPGSQHDEHTRSMLLEEFFETNSTLQVDGPLYMKADSKKGWKRYHFVLRSSGLYYFPKEKTKNTRDLACLTLFNGYNVYRGIGWKKKWKAPTDFTFGFKSAVDSSLGKTCRTLKMLCAEDIQTMEKWITAIRISKYGKQLWDNQKALMEDLSMCDGMSNSSFAVSMRSESISSISSAVPSQCGSVSSAISSMSNSSSGRMSRASSSSSSGCLSDDNNGFDSEFTTGTIKRKPSMKPNLPLTSMTRQLKEVGEITNSVVGGGGDSSGTDGNSPERSGTLTRRHSRRKSQESNGSGTLKRRPQPTALAKRGGSVESMNAVNSSGSSNSTPTPTPSICAKPLMVDYEMRQAIAPSVGGGGVVDAMSCSTLSLDSLPPPPPPPAVHDEQEIYGSQLSLVSLPPPPPPEEVAAATVGASVVDYAGHIAHSMAGLGAQQHQPAPPPPSAMLAQPPSHYHAVKSNGLPPAVPAKPIKPAVKPAPPYKAPPEYVPQSTQPAQSPQPTTTTNTTTTQKKVSFADSPVLLRRKMCSPEPRSPSTPPNAVPTHAQLAQAQAAQAQAQAHYYALATGAVALPTTGPRVDFTRLSNASAASSGAASGSYTGIMNAVQDFGSPKRLQESTSNPPRDFLKDLQRVMRKKWQVAQKCKLEPATTPHEVLGFRDFSSEELLAHNLNNANVNNSHYYRETANVSNWVQEHYGAGAVPPPPPPPLSNEYALYENLHAGNADGTSAVNTNGSSLLMEPQFPHIQMQAQAAAAAHALAMAQARKKRPPPPPPKRSDSTHLTHRA